MTPRGYGPAARFCPRCAAALAGPPPVACAGCGYQLFLNARPTVNLVVLDGDPERPSFLALLRAAEPRAGWWETPGGFCDGPEHPADAARREAREELGVDVTLGDLIGMYVGSYEFQDEMLPLLEMFYLATIPSGRVTLDPGESSDMKWFPLVEPPTLAFSTMNAAVNDVARRLGYGPV
nr:NUDIX domain-containing protein [Micromonospora sp. DSM 115978]